MAQKGQKQDGMSCGEVLLCVVSAHKGIAPYPYIWQQHVANSKQCQWRVHYLSLERSKLNFINKCTQQSEMD